MAQPQGPSSTAGGRLDGSIGTAVTAGDFALGAGWGGSTLAVTSGSTVHRGEIIITAATGGGLSQGTSTIVFTYPQGAFAAKPWFFITCTNDNSLTALHAFTTAQATTTTTALTITSQIVAVDTKIYTVRWLCVA